MTAFQSLLGKKEKSNPLPIIQAKRQSKKKSVKRGCEFCTLNSVPGVHKIKGQVCNVNLTASDELFAKKKRRYEKGKKTKYKPKRIMVWAESPGPRENKAGIELIGPSGEFLWKEMAAAGITRKMCDVQNVVRCFPADRTEDEWPPLRMRKPTKHEIRCCSIFTDQAIERTEAKLHLVFGQIAAAALLGREYKKDRRIFWSDKLKAKVILLDHPAYFIRQGYGGSKTLTPSTKLKQFREGLRYAAKLAKAPGGRWGFLRSQRYISVDSTRLARKAYRAIRSECNRGGRIVPDFESGRLDRRGRATRDGSGKEVALCCGFATKPGVVWVFWLDHPDAPVTERVRRYNRKIVRRILSSSHFKKALHHGSADSQMGRSLVGCPLNGYDYDTEYGEYFKFPDAKSYGLTAIANRRFPEFAGYKEIIVPDALTDVVRQSKKIDKLNPAQLLDLGRRTTGGMNYALIPWKKMLLYNGADCDLTKRVELSTDGSAPHALMRVYRDAGFVLDGMEKDGPLFDYKHCEVMKRLFPIRAKKWLKKIRKIASKYGKKWADIKPSQKRFAELLYDVMGLPEQKNKKKKRTTDKAAMERLAEKYPIAKYTGLWRHDTKANSTYVEGFENCANLNDGRLRTKWWQTGTGTGRISSGGGRGGEKDKQKKVVNLQNIHGNPFLQCLVVSDLLWRDIYLYWLRHGNFTEKSWRRFENYYVHLGFDHAQMELRVLAQKSGDKRLRKAFASRDSDPHAEVGHTITGWSIEKITNDDRTRRLVKNMHFGIIFGLTEEGIFDYVVRKGVKDAKESEVRKHYRNYFRKYKAVRPMIERDHAFAEKYGFVKTLTGLKRDLNISAQQEEGYQGAFWKNQAVNTPIQGTASHCMLMGLVPLKRKPKKYKLLRHPQLEIHDAIYFRLKLKYLWEAIRLGQGMLEKAPIRILRGEFKIDWQVPFKAEPKAAFRFGVQVKDLGVKGKGPMTTAEFLNVWCRKNQALEKKLKEELAEV